jgi:hypothetical protein
MGGAANHRPIALSLAEKSDPFAAAGPIRRGQLRGGREAFRMRGGNGSGEGAEWQREQDREAKVAKRLAKGHRMQLHFSSQGAGPMHLHG